MPVSGVVPGWADLWRWAQLAYPVGGPGALPQATVDMACGQARVDRVSGLETPLCGVTAASYLGLTGNENPVASSNI